MAYNPLGWNRTEIVRIPVSMYFVFRFVVNLLVSWQASFGSHMIEKLDFVFSLPAYLK